MNIENVINILNKLQITGISDDTRYLEPNDAFVCRKGKHYQGSDFVIEAILKGAKAIITEKQIEAVTVPVILCDNIEKNFEKLLNGIYGKSWQNVKLIGITGTDGKTTTATIIKFLIGLSFSCGYIGTNGIRYNGIKTVTQYTTPPLCLLIKTLTKMANADIPYCAMEVSSEGIINNRLETIRFHSAVFTNLSHEHLNTHITMENYFQAKAKLFNKLYSDGLAIINNDSPYGHRIKHSRLTTFGIENISDWQALKINIKSTGMTFDLKTPNGIIKNIKTNMMGKYNIYNIMAAIIAATDNCIPLPKILRNLKNIPEIPGRMELITGNENFKVYVDFAHTPNALKEVLFSLKRPNNRLIAILGSAGGKDKTKRPEMGKIACDIADYVVFTSEDPRNENPEDIIQDMTSTTDKKNYEIILNRKTAIKKVILQAQAKDVIIITGKGNDRYFEQNNNIYSYSDITEATKALQARKNK